MASALRFGPRAVHLCVDMQTLFAERTDWHSLARARATGRDATGGGAARPDGVYPLCAPERPEEAAGAWRRYYEHWRNMTGDRINPRLIELVPPLAALAPPDLVIDKAHYSPFKEAAFLRTLGWLKAEALVISGAETDVCVLAAVMDAVDAGYRVILAGDALCSASDESHDAVLRHFGARFSQQVEIASTEEILSGWRAGEARAPG